jgi:hypothetical protein
MAAKPKPSSRAAFAMDSSDHQPAGAVPDFLSAQGIKG